MRSIAIEPREFVFRYRSFEHFLDVFRTYYGPLNLAFAALGERGVALEEALRALCARFDRGGPDGFVVPSAYAEVCIAR